MFRILNKLNSGLLKRVHQRCPIHTTSASQRINDCELQARYMYSAEVENAVNVQVAQELYASHQYLAMASHFGRTEIGLIGSSGMFLGMSDEERQHALGLMKYQNIRGGSVTLSQIPQPNQQTWPSLLTAVAQALQLEMENARALMVLYGIAELQNDAMLMDYLTAEYLHHQMKDLQTLGNILARLRLAGDGLGVVLIDQELGKLFPYSGPTNISSADLTAT